MNDDLVVGPVFTPETILVRGGFINMLKPGAVIDRDSASCLSRHPRDIGHNVIYVRPVDARLVKVNLVGQGNIFFINSFLGRHSVIELYKSKICFCESSSEYHFQSIVGGAEWRWKVGVKLSLSAV